LCTFIPWKSILLYPGNNADKTYSGQFHEINLESYQVFRQIINNGKALLNGAELVKLTS